jgi:hypothetical protein
MHPNNQTLPKLIKSWNASYVLFMGDTNWKQTCIQMIVFNSNLAKIKQVMEMQVAYESN